MSCSDYIHIKLPICAHRLTFNQDMGFGFNADVYWHVYFAKKSLHYIGKVTTGPSGEIDVDFKDYDMPVSLFNLYQGETLMFFTDSPNDECVRKEIELCSKTSSTISITVSDTVLLSGDYLNNYTCVC